MSDSKREDSRRIVWTDLTVEDAESVKEFYAEVVGWGVEAVSMGEYDDYNMTAGPQDTPIAGVCHVRGSNADMPPIWMIYITVDDLDASIASCRRLGGKVISRPKHMGGHGRYRIIADPAVAVSSLFEQTKD